MRLRRRDPGAEIGDGLFAGLEVFGRPRGDDDVGPEAGELRRNRFPEAGSATGDEHARALEGAGRQGAGPDRWWGWQAGELTHHDPR